MSNTEAEPLRPRQAVDRLQRRLETLADGPLDDITLSLQARIILGQLNHHAVLLDRAGRILDTNDNLLAVTGTSRGRVVGVHLWSAPWWHVGSGAVDTLRFLLQQANNDEPVRALVDLQHVGEMLGRSHEVTISPVTDTSGESVFFLAEIRDVADRLAAESIIDDRARDLQAAEARYQLLVEHSSDLIGRHDLDGRYVNANGSALTVLGRTADEMVGTLLVDLVHPDDRTPTLRAFHPAARTYTEGLKLRHRLRHHDGSYRMCETLIHPLLNANGRPVQLQSITRDLTAGSITGADPDDPGADTLMAALHDGLTGLPNRTLLIDRLGQAMANSQRNHKPVAVLVIDLDGFELVNETIGHSAADGALRALAERLHALVRPGDTLARMASDEFAMICIDTEGPTAAAVVARRILNAFDEPLLVQGRQLTLSASVGVATSTGGSDPLYLLDCADAAMARAKSEGRGTVALHNPADEEAAHERQRLELSLRRALERNEFRLHYQPEHELSSGRLAGFEALIRWERVAGELVPPNDFIPIAEETGLIVEIGAWVIKEATRQLSLWRAMLDAPPPPVWVNLSARQLGDPNLVDTVRNAIADANIEPEWLALELTESALLDDPDVAAHQLGELRALGCKIGLDDFGTGYSSLSHLTQFPLDVLKIDRSFVSGLGRSPHSATIVGGVIELAHGLGLTVIAEGVESSNQLDALRALGCDQAVGFYFSEPIEPARCAALFT